MAKRKTRLLLLLETADNKWLLSDIQKMWVRVLPFSLYLSGISSVVEQRKTWLSSICCSHQPNDNRYCIWSRARWFDSTIPAQERAEDLWLLYLHKPTVNHQLALFFI